MINMIRYYCTKCHQICEYMCEKTIVCLAQPMTVDDKYTCKQYNDSKYTEGSICLLCGEHLSLNPKDYKVEVVVIDDNEYINSIDIWEIHKYEKKYMDALSE